MSDKRLTCPSCGWDGVADGKHWPSFRYLEEVTNEREVEGFDEHGVLRVSGEDHIGLEDGGENHRLLCGNCLTEFAVPDGIEVEFG